MKRTIRYLLALALNRTGCVAAFRRWRAGRQESAVRILAYHGIDERENLIEMFMPPDFFDAQLDHLRRHYRVIDLDDVAAWLDGDRVLESDSVVITLDDGYKDNYLHALPILEKHGLRATVFLSTDFVERGVPTPVDRLLRAAEHSRVENIRLPERGLGQFQVSTASGRRNAVLALDEMVNSLAYEDRECFLDECLRAFGHDPDDDLFADAMITWDDARAMADGPFLIGAHTRSHPVLAQIEGDALREEIEGCKAAVERALGRPCRHFAYPFGSRDAISDEAIAAVEAAGYQTAVVLYRNQCDSNTRFQLGRVMISQDMVLAPNGSFSEDMFACEVSGLFDFVFRRR